MEKKNYTKEDWLTPVQLEAYIYIVENKLTYYKWLKGFIEHFVLKNRYGPYSFFPYLWGSNGIKGSIEDKTIELKENLPDVKNKELYSKVVQDSIEYEKDFLDKYDGLLNKYDTLKDLNEFDSEKFYLHLECYKQISNILYWEDKEEPPFNIPMAE